MMSAALVMAGFLYIPALHGVFGTASLGLDAVRFAVPFRFIVWGAGEIRRWLLRRRETVARALAKEPAERLQTEGELGREARAALGG